MNPNRKRLLTVDEACGTLIKATVATSARGTPLVGTFVVIPSDDDLVLGRITKVSLTNPIHSDDKFAPMIMERGLVPHWSGEVDIERAEIDIIAAIDTKIGKRIPFRRNPASGTVVLAADHSEINLFANEQTYQLILGYIPNTNGLPCSVINRHFADMHDQSGKDIGGYGEARHSAIFGQSGSGKTVLLTMLISGRLAACPQMGLLMPDTSGDLADPNRHSRGSYRWNYDQVLKQAGVSIERISIADIRLTSPDTLKYKLAPLLREQLSIASEKAVTLSDRVVHGLFGTEVELDRLTAPLIADAVIEYIGGCYEAKTKADKIRDAQSLKDDQRRMDHFRRSFETVRRLFDGRYPLWQLVRDILEHGRKIIIEMNQIAENDQRFVMHEVIEKLTNQARRLFHKSTRCNAMIVLDEAQRWVPEGNGDEETISRTIAEGFRETRKYGIGWIVVAQSPAGLSKRVIRECHTKYFGRNLGIGSDRAHIQDILSKEGAEAYQQLQIQGGYFWVGVGLDANLGSGSSYFTLHPFDGDATQAFINANQHIFSSSNNVGQ